MEYFSEAMECVDAINAKIRHFPKELIEEILRAKLPLTKDLLPILILLPNQAHYSDVVYQMAAAGQLLAYSRLVHETVVNEETPASRRAVLLGDLLSSAAYQKIIEVKQDKDMEEIASIMAATDEAWFMKNSLGIKEKEERYLEILRREYGDLYGKIMEIGADIAGFPEETKALYRAIGMHIGLLWGGRQNGYPLAESALSDQLEREARKLDVKSAGLVSSLHTEILTGSFRSLNQ